MPDHAVLAIAGDISMARGAQARRREARRLEEGRHAGCRPSAIRPPLGPAKVYFIARPNSVQTSLCVGTQAHLAHEPGLRRRDGDERGDRRRPDRPAVHAPARGEGLHLRRVQQRLARCSTAAPGSASTDVRTEVTEPALRDLIGRNRADARRSRCPTKEFARQEARHRRVVRAVARVAERRAEQPHHALALQAAGRLLGQAAGPHRWRSRRPQVQAAAKKYLDPARLQIVAVGDASKIADSLKKFGTVETYDTNGKRIGQ